MLVNTLILTSLVCQALAAGHEFYEHMRKRRDEPSFCNRDLSSLRMLLIVSRHGDTTPQVTFPTDLYNEETWPTGLGQLTRRGIERAYELGKWTRDCYGTFIHKNVSPKRVYVRSSDYDCSLQSAQAYLAGTYPPDTAFQTGIQTWGETWGVRLGQLWQPFSVHTVPIKYDALLKGEEYCPRFDELKKEINFSPKVKALLARDMKFLKKVITKSGIKSDDVLNVVATVERAVLVQVVNGRTPVHWLSSEADIDKLAYYRDLMVKLYFENREMDKITSGVLIAEILERILSRVSATTSLEHILYVTHSAVMEGLLGSLGVLDSLGHHEPPWGAAVIFELHKLHDNSFAVATFYRNTSTHDPVPLKVSGCDNVDANCKTGDKMADSKHKKKDGEEGGQGKEGKDGSESDAENSSSASHSQEREDGTKRRRIFCRLHDFKKSLSKRASHDHAADCAIQQRPAAKSSESDDDDDSLDIKMKVKTKSKHYPKHHPKPHHEHHKTTTTTTTPKPTTTHKPKPTPKPKPKPKPKHHKQKKHRKVSHDASSSSSSSSAETEITIGLNLPESENDNGEDTPDAKL